MNLAMLGQVTPIRGCPISGREKCACNCDTGQKQYIYIIFIYNYFSRGNSIHSLSLSLPHRPHSDWAAIHSPSHGVHVHVEKYCRFFFFQTTTTESNKEDKKDIHIVITHSRRKKNDWTTRFGYKNHRDSTCRKKGIQTSDQFILIELLALEMSGNSNEWSRVNMRGTVK